MWALFKIKEFGSGCEVGHLEGSLLWRNKFKGLKLWVFQQRWSLKSFPSVLSTFQFQFYNTPHCANLGRKLAHLAEPCMNNSFKCHADSQKVGIFLWRKCLIRFFRTTQNIALYEFYQVLSLKRFCTIKDLMNWNPKHMVVPSTYFFPRLNYGDEAA